jgi:hypothetical protein
LYNFTLTPTVTDDNTLGYLPGSRWTLDDGTTYVCTDASTGAAVWDEQTNTVFTKKTTLSAANVAALNTTPITIAFGESGKVIEILDVFGAVKGGTIFYTSNETLQIAYSSLPTVSTWDESKLLDSASVGVIRRFVKTVSAGGQGMVMGDDIVVTNVTGNPSGGDLEIDVYITYKVIKM